MEKKNPRAEGKDITELFGLSPDDRSKSARELTLEQRCPFVEGQCTKQFHEGIVNGVCSVSNGAKKEVGSEVIICPKRLYANDYESLRHISRMVWPDRNDFIVGGTTEELARSAKARQHPIVAFGQGSGKEISVKTASHRMSLDWVLQSYEQSDRLVAREFVGVEVQSIDITNNYRDNWSAYLELRSSKSVEKIPNSKHGLNWANVHKRLIPQIIRKGNIYRDCHRCIGFFFIIPTVVFEKFLDILPDVDFTAAPGRSVVSVLSYSLGQPKTTGSPRELVLDNCQHLSLDSLIESFSRRDSSDAASELDLALQTILT